MKRLISVSLVIALTTSLISNKPAKANPAVLAPVAFCAGTAGVGCILVGTAVISGIVYYVWRNSNGKQAIADAKGNVLRHTPEPEDFERDQVIATYTARSQKDAANKCKFLSRERELEYVRVEKRGGKYVCIAK